MTPEEARKKAYQIVANCILEYISESDDLISAEIEKIRTALLNASATPIL